MALAEDDPDGSSHDIVEERKYEKKKSLGNSKAPPSIVMPGSPSSVPDIKNIAVNLLKNFDEILTLQQQVRNQFHKNLDLIRFISSEQESYR